MKWYYQIRPFSFNSSELKSSLLATSIDYLLLKARNFSHIDVQKNTTEQEQEQEEVLQLTVNLPGDLIEVSSGQGVIWGR